MFIELAEKYTHIIYFILLFIIFISNSCSEDKPTEPTTENNNFTSDAISIGEFTHEISEDVGVGGGTIIVSNPESELNGLEITIPKDGYNETRNFKVSSAPITNHKLGENFNPVSPIITIQNGGGYSEIPMKIKIPVTRANNEFLIGFLYNEVTGEIEALPIIELENSFIMVETRHFTLSSITSDVDLGKTSEISRRGNLVISSILESTLLGQSVINSGFTPGVDDWEFINYGSYISPGGHCAGQSMSAMWYFHEKKLKGEQSLFHRFDKINNSEKPNLLWEDNPLGYRFASSLQEDAKWSFYEQIVNIQSRLPEVTWKTFIAAMLITGQPQSVIIKNSSTNAGHAMIIYKINLTEGKLYVADPNYPNNRSVDGSLSIRTISYSDGILGPYPSFAKVGDSGTIYDQIAFFAKTANFDWEKIGKRYKELESEIIGYDRFLDYRLSVKTATNNITLEDIINVNEDTLKIYCRNTNISGFLPGTDHLQKINVYDASGNFIMSSGADGIAKLKLVPGTDKYGLYICGYQNNRADYYYDFRWVTVNYNPSNNGDDKILKSKGCVVKIHFKGNYKLTDQNNEVTEVEKEDYWGHFSATGSFSGNTFTGSYEKTQLSSNYVGTVVITLNDDLNKVTSIDWFEDYTSSFQNNIEATSTSSFSGNDIAVSGQYPHVFETQGEQTCNNLVLVEYSYQNTSTLISESLVGYKCNEYSYIHIGFLEE